MDGEVPFTHYADVNPKRALRRGEPYPFVEMAALPAGGGELSYLNYRVFDGQGSRFAVGDTLFARITPCTENGKTSIVRNLNGSEVGFGSTEFIVLAARAGISDPEFVHQVAVAPAVRSRAVSRMLGTSGRQRVPTWFFEDELRLPTFSLQEQRAIGGTLRSIDEAIEKTEAVIATTEKLRKALLQELLTRGLPGWHTEWKTVPGIGTIPACWEVVRLGEVADPNLPGATQSGPFGSDLLHSEFTDSGKLVIGIDNVLNGEFSLGSQHRISEPKFEKLRKYQARPGDVLITIMATVGRCCVVPEDVEDAVITKHVFRISVDSSRANPRFVMTSLLLAPSVLSELFASAQGLTRLGLNGTLLRQIRLPLPALREQGVVADTQRILGKRLEGERQLATHLRAIKRETASALLSGRVRVPAVEAMVPVGVDSP